MDQEIITESMFRLLLGQILIIKKDILIITIHVGLGFPEEIAPL